MKRISRDTAWLFVMLLSVALYAFASRPAGRWAGEDLDPGPPPRRHAAASAQPDLHCKSVDLSGEKRTLSSAERSEVFRRGAVGSVRIFPELRNGAPYGSRIAQVSARSWFWKLGLRPGDVVTAVNGHPARTEHDAEAIHAILAGDDRLVFDVERDGQRKRLEVEFR